MDDAILKLLLLFMMPMFVAAASASTVYKWVDENGATHYSDTVPAGRAGGEVHIPPPPPQEVTDEAIRRFREQQTESKQREAEQRAEAMSREAAMRYYSGIRKSRCTMARTNLHKLNKQRPVYHLNEKGEEVYLDDKERAAVTKLMNTIAANNCDPRF